MLSRMKLYPLTNRDEIFNDKLPEKLLQPSTGCCPCYA